MRELNTEQIVLISGGKDAQACANDIMTGGGMGATLGALIGGAIGTIGGPVGIAAGTFLGGMAGAAFGGGEVAESSPNCR